MEDRHFDMRNSCHICHAKSIILETVDISLFCRPLDGVCHISVRKLFSKL